MNPFIIPAAITAGGAILGGLLGKSDRPKGPKTTDYQKWLETYGPEMWGALKTHGMGMLESPYGLGGDVRAGMRRTARQTSTAGYESARRNIGREISRAGLSPSGGEAARREYVAGRQFGEGLGQAYTEIDVLDFQAREQQRARAENLLINLSTESPAYAQIAAQNYWNALDYQQNQAAMYAQGIGGAAGSAYEMYMMGKMMNQDPYAPGMGGGYGSTPGGYMYNMNPYYSGYTNQPPVDYSWQPPVQDYTQG